MKINVGVIFGGKSVEHEISIISAVEAMGYMDTNKYNVIPIYIDKDGTWYTGEHLKDIINYRDIELVKRYAKKVCLIRKDKSCILQSLGLFKRTINIIDIVFPIGHGLYMEDGSLQGYLNMLGVPYVGSGVVASAIGQDKVFMKQILSCNNIPTTNYIWFTSKEFSSNKKKVLEKINTLSYPVYVKPANLGSSIGISRVTSEQELLAGIKEAIKFDNKIIVEEEIKHVKEVNISVLGTYDNLETSELEEINVNDEFFTFKEKYVENYSKVVKKGKKVNPLLSKEMVEDLKEYAINTFKAINARGVARIDFLIDDKTKKIYVSEINTIPGSLSLYLWLPKKNSQNELINDLINIAIEEYKNKQNLILSFNNNLLDKFDILDGKKLKK